MEKTLQTKKTQCGQYRPYDDFFREWEIETELSKEEVLDYCFNELIKRKIPEHAEWSKEIKYGTGSHFSDASYYFHGWYELNKIEGGYKFIQCEPFAD